MVAKRRGYDESRRRHGGLAVWVPDEAVQAWAAGPGASRGGQPTYSALAILTVLTPRCVPPGVPLGQGTTSGVPAAAGSPVTRYGVVRLTTEVAPKAYGWSGHHTAATPATSRQVRSATSRAARWSVADRR